MQTATIVRQPQQQGGEAPSKSHQKGILLGPQGELLSTSITDSQPNVAQKRTESTQNTPNVAQNDPERDNATRIPNWLIDSDLPASLTLRLIRKMRNGGAK